MINYIAMTLLLLGVCLVEIVLGQTPSPIQNLGITSGALQNESTNTLELSQNNYQRRFVASLNKAAVPPIIPTVGPTVNPMCGSTYALNSVGDTAMITSPGWPGKYPNYANCSWTITNGMSQAYSVEFTFISFATEYEYDKLVVSDNEKGDEPSVFSGTVLSGEKFSFTASRLDVGFTSDYSIPGSGFEIRISLLSKCVNSYALNSVGDTAMITSPGWPGNYPAFANCSWTVTNGMSLNYTMKFSFLYVSLIDDLVVYKEGAEPVIFNWRTPNDNKTYYFVASSLDVAFTPTNIVSSDYYSSRGFQIQLSLIPTVNHPLCGSTYALNSVEDTAMITFPGWPGIYPNYRSCSWTVITGMSLNYTMQFTFLYVRLDHNDELVVYKQGAEPVIFYGPMTNQTYYFVASRLDVAYKSCNLYCQYQTKFQMQLSLIPTNEIPMTCGNNYALNSVGDTAMITSPGWPAIYPNYQNCSWTVTNGVSPNYTIQFLFIYFSMPAAGQKFLVYKPGAEHVSLEVKYLSQYNNWKKHKIAIRRIFPSASLLIVRIGSGSQIRNETYYFVASSLVVVFRSSSLSFFDGDKPGFQIQLSLIPTVNPRCGSTYALNSVEDSAIITSPGWPAHYPIFNCSWTVINEMTSNYSIQLSYVTLDYSLSYVFLGLVVYQKGAEPVTIPDFYDPQSIKNYSFSASSLNLVKSRNAYSNFPVHGFQIQLKLIPTPTRFLCGSPIRLVPGTSMVITSPNYPGLYPNNALCTWNVTASNAHIRIDSNFFDVESIHGDGYEPCYSDYVQVTTAFGHNHGSKHCGDRGIHNSYADSVLIQFVSDSSIQKLGFNLTISSKIIPTVGPTVNPMCGSTYALNTLGDTAMITSPGWPGKYPNNANCSWTVTNGMSSSYSVQFSFVTFYTESGYDELLVYQQGAEPVGFDGNATGRNYSFTGSSLNVIFTSDYVITKAGFQIQLSLIPTPFTCPTGAFKCHSSNNCVPAAKRCDGHSDCPDNSDENGPWCKMPNQCGISSIPPNLHSRIVGGTTATPGSWPWQVSVHMIQNDGSLFQICGGSLISPHWIISAAHCFYGDTRNPGQFVFKIGSWNKFSMDSPYEVDIQAKGIWIHPHYNRHNHTNDISLIKLATDVPFPFNNHTNGVCIPQPGYIVPANTQCVISGWGTTSAGGKSGPFLQQAVVPVVSNSVCGDGNHYQPGQIDGTMICAGLEKGGKDTCQGDTGGPLVCHNPGTGQWVLQGITSWGSGCALPHYPGVYARVSALTDFIFNTVNKQD